MPWLNAIAALLQFDVPLTLPLPVVAPESVYATRARLVSSPALPLKAIVLPLSVTCGESAIVGAATSVVPGMTSSVTLCGGRGSDKEPPAIVTSAACVTAFVASCQRCAADPDAE